MDDWPPASPPRADRSAPPSFPAGRGRQSHISPSPAIGCEQLGLLRGEAVKKKPRGMTPRGSEAFECIVVLFCPLGLAAAVAGKRGVGLGDRMLGLVPEGWRRWMLLGGWSPHATATAYCVRGLGGHGNFGLRALRGGQKCFWGVLRALTQGRSEVRQRHDDLLTAPWNPSQKCHDEPSRRGPAPFGGQYPGKDTSCRFNPNVPCPVSSSFACLLPRETEAKKEFREANPLFPNRPPIDDVEALTGQTLPEWHAPPGLFSTRG